MIEWLTALTEFFALVAGIFCLVMGLLGRTPNDLTMGATALVALMLIVQFFVALAAPLFGNNPTGSLLEFYIYLVSAILVPIGAGFWALVDRTRWSNVVLAVAGFAVAVMVFRMNQIWFVQGL